MKPNWPIKKLREVALVAILIAILVAPLVYIHYWKPEKGFWDNAVGNLLATVLALIAGIPVALWLDRLAQKRDKEQKKLEDRKREKEILVLIKEELSFDLDRLNDRTKNKNSLPLHPFKTDLWDAFSDSGEIRYIKDPGLLNRITSAYHIVKIVKDIELECYKAMRSATVTFGNQTAQQLLLQDARTFDKQHYDNTKTAIEEIDKYLR